MVTGGAKGIGAAVVQILGHAGAHVTVFDLDAPDGSSVDVTCETAVQDAFARTGRRGSGDSLSLQSGCALLTGITLPVDSGYLAR